MLQRCIYYDNSAPFATSVYKRDNSAFRPQEFHFLKLCQLFRTLVPSRLALWTDLSARDQLLHQRTTGSRCYCDIWRWRRPRCVCEVAH